MEATKLYDVVIVGAGPSGCAAAYDLAEKKLSVLLVDKTEFPRNKPCAGGLTVKTVKTLRYSVDPIVINICNEIYLGNGKGKKKK